MLLNILLEEQVQDITILMSLFELDLVRYRKLSCLLQILDFIPVYDCVFLYGV